MTIEQDWKGLLSQWDYLIQPKLNEDKKLLLQGNMKKFALDYGMLGDENISKVSVPGCSSENIAILEKRLNTSLPSSYKNFLIESDGAYLFERTIKLLSHSEIDWLKNVDPELLKVWGDGPSDVPDKLYFVYGDKQDCINMRDEYLKDCLAISSQIDGDMYLLNPKVKNENGEWEAWFFGCKNPGAYRYRTFWDMMLKLFSEVEDYLENW